MQLQVFDQDYVALQDLCGWLLETLICGAVVDWIQDEMMTWLRCCSSHQWNIWRWWRSSLFFCQSEMLIYEEIGICHGVAMVFTWVVQVDQQLLF